jgi:hypothetical protein
MRRSTTVSRIVILATLAAWAVALIGATPAVLARNGDTAGRRVLMDAKPGREIGGNRPFRHVDVRTLPQRTTAGPAYEPGLLRPSFPAPTGRSPRPMAAPSPAPVVPTAAPPLNQPTSVAGLTAADTNAEPPDPWVAAGPEHVIQAVNTSLRLFDRSGTALATTTMFDFFGLSAIGGGYQAEVFDPRVIYDSLHGRWIAIEASFDCYQSTTASVGTGYIDIAISDSADAAAGWSVLSIPYPDAVPDYPGIGTSTDKVVVSANVFGLQATGTGLGCAPSGSAFIGTELDVMAWSELVGTGSVQVDYLYSPNHFDNDFFSWRPALQVPATSATVFAVAENDSEGVAFARITGNPVSNNTAISTPMDLTAANVIAAFAEPPQPHQPGSPGTIVNALDGRPTDAVWQGNQLAFVSTYPCDPIGGAAEDRDCVRVSELATSPATPTLVQDFLISEEGADHYLGGVGYAGNGTLHAVWTRSSATAPAYPSSYSAYQGPTDTANQLSAPQLLAAGTDTYPGQRWGDYVGVAQDPQVPNAVWQGNQYSVGAPGWATRVSQLQSGGASFVPITPKRVVDSRSAVGVTGAFAVNVPKTFQVAGVSPIPSDAIAVTGNVTTVGQTAAGFISVTPTATTTPSSSTLNFPFGDIRANNFTVPLDGTGRLAAVYKASSTGKQTHVIVDITGYFVAGTAAATYATIAPVRALDTRPAPFHVGPLGRFSAGQTQTLSIAGDVAGIPSDATAITGNLTVVGQTNSGLLSVTPDPPVGPLASSTLNFPVGDTRANGLTADLNGSGDLSITFSSTVGSAKTHVLLDVTGYYVDAPTGLLFYPLTPGRILDTRPGVVLSGLSNRFNTGVPRTLPTAGHWGVQAGADAVTGNLTVVNQTSGGFVSITPDPDSAPTTSTLNFPLGDTRANGVTVPVNGSGNMSLVYRTTTSGKTTHLILDVTGYFN